jgi:hypothetical protein
MMQETKDNFIEIIQKIKVADDFKNPIIKFIETYDGHNEYEFLAFCYTVVTILNKLNVLTAKADGYDDLKEIEDNYKNVLEELREDYKAAASGDIIPELPLPATDREYPVPENNKIEDLKDPII